MRRGKGSTVDEQQDRPDEGRVDEPGIAEEAQAEAGVPEPEVEADPDEGEDLDEGRPRPCLPPRARRRDVRRQWRKGVRGTLVVIERSIPEDPRADRIRDLVPGFRRRTWRRAFAAWAAAELAMSQTALGTLLPGARVVLVPDGGRFSAWSTAREAGLLDDLTGPFRDPARCLAAARARLAADVVRQAPLLHAAEVVGLDCEQVRAQFLDVLEDAGIPVERDAEPQP